MNVLCIGYYDKFSRFFLQIKKKLKQQNLLLKLTIESTYFSGFLYGFIRFQSGGWISMNAWLKVWRNQQNYQKHLAKNTIYKGFNIDELFLNQHVTNYLKCQAMAYIDLFEKKLQNIDTLLMIGDLRLPFEIAKKIAFKNNIPVYFLEQGPFATTFIDTNGVNANANIRGYKPDSAYNKNKKDKVTVLLNRTKYKKYHRLPVYRGLDYLLELLLKKTLFFPPDLKIDHPLFKNSSKQIAEKIFKATEHPNKNVYLLICQVPYDVNMTHHSPHYNNHFDILRDVHQNLPENSILIVREHPVYSGKYEDTFYQYIVSHENIYTDSNKNFTDVLNAADAVIVNNSTVGLEAISHNKNVLVLANSYYDDSEICLKMNNRNELKELLKEVLNYQPDQNKIIDFLHQFFTKQVVEGFITDKKLIAADTVFQRIFEYYKH